jgi:hypothetical protein
MHDADAIRGERKMKTIYLIFDYQEHGPEKAVCTDDKSLVEEMALAYARTYWTAEAFEAKGAEFAAGAIKALDDPDLYTMDGVFVLDDGWGAETIRAIQLFQSGEAVADELFSYEIDETKKAAEG